MKTKIIKTKTITRINMLIGIVGKPSSGKSTFFKASTLAEVEIANYPFTTIKPNHGTGFVKVDCVDKEFNVIVYDIWTACFQRKINVLPCEIACVKNLCFW